MNILTIGDIVGKTGLETARNTLKELNEKIDFIIQHCLHKDAHAGSSHSLI